jgi:hypothetical protein
VPLLPDADHAHPFFLGEHDAVPTPRPLDGEDAPLSGLGPDHAVVIAVVVARNR